MHSLKSILRYRSNYIYFANFVIFLIMFLSMLLYYLSNNVSMKDYLQSAFFIISPIIAFVCFAKLLSNASDWYDVRRKISKLSHRIENHQKDARMYFIRGNYYYKIADYESAINDYTDAILLKKDFAEAYNNRGIAYTMEGDWSDTQSSLRDWEKAKELGLKVSKKKIKSIPSDDEFSDVLQKLWQ